MSTQQKARPTAKLTGAGTPTLYVHDDVLDEIMYNARYRNDRLAVGVLIGHQYVCPENGESYVEVEGYVAGSHVPDLSDFTRHLRSQWRAASAAQSHHCPSGSILGWYAAASDGDLDLGQEVLLLHHTFFNQPWQTGLVLKGSMPPCTISVMGEEIAGGPVGKLLPAA